MKKKFNEASLSEKEDFYSHLNMEDITNADYSHAKRVCKHFEKKKFRIISWFVCSKCLKTVEICVEIYELDPRKFLSAPGLAWQAALKKTKAKLDSLTDIGILLMLEISIRGGIFIYMQKLITNRWKITIKIKCSHIFNIRIK